MEARSKEDAQKGSVLRQIVALERMSFKELRERFEELLPGVNIPPNRPFVIRRIAQKLQEDTFGGLSGPARERLEKLKIEINPLKDLKATRRLPLPGAVITKSYKGHSIEVKILHKGFEYGGKQYRSLSSIAREVTGVHQSGFVFFGV